MQFSQTHVYVPGNSALEVCKEVPAIHNTFRVQKEALIEPTEAKSWMFLGMSL